MTGSQPAFQTCLSARTPQKHSVSQLPPRCLQPLFSFPPPTPLLRAAHLGPCGVEVASAVRSLQMVDGSAVNFAPFIQLIFLTSSQRSPRASLGPRNTFSSLRVPLLFRLLFLSVLRSRGVSLDSLYFFWRNRWIRHSVFDTFVQMTESAPPGVNRSSRQQKISWTLYFRSLTVPLLSVPSLLTDHSLATGGTKFWLQGQAVAG